MYDKCMKRRVKFLLRQLRLTSDNDDTVIITGCDAGERIYSYYNITSVHGTQIISISKSGRAVMKL